MGGDSSSDGQYDNGENVTPRHVNKTTRPDGSTSIVYGNERNSSGRITDPHGHSVINKDNSLDYSRSKDGEVRLDNSTNKSNSK